MFCSLVRPIRLFDGCKLLWMLQLVSLLLWPHYISVAEWSSLAVCEAGYRVQNCSFDLHMPAWNGFVLPQRVLYTALGFQTVSWLRSIYWGDLYQLRTRTRHYDPRNFHSSGPTVWNSLPPVIKDHVLSLTQLKDCLKHYLFCMACDTNISHYPFVTCLKRASLALLFIIAITVCIFPVHKCGLEWISCCK